MLTQIDIDKDPNFEPEDINHIKHHFTFIRPISEKHNNQIYITNSKDEKLLIAIPKISSDLVGLHNPKILTNKETESTAGNLVRKGIIKKDDLSLQKLLWKTPSFYVGKNESVVELCLQANKPYVFIGDIEQYTGKVQNDLACDWVMNVKFITGENRTDLLKYLDGQVLKYRFRSKAVLGSCLGFAFGHMGLKYAYKNYKASEV